MELSELSYLVAVIEERSFTQGAVRAGVVQSAVSAGIARLEKELGEQLVHRGPPAVVPTEAGGLVYRHALAVLGSMQAIRDEVRAIRGGLTGTVSFGVLASTGDLNLPAVLAAFGDAHREVTVSVVMVPGPIETRLHPVRDGFLDLALVPVVGPLPVGVEFIPITRACMVLVGPQNDLLAHATGVTLDQLRGRRFVDFPVSWGNRALVDELFASRGESRDVRTEGTDAATVLSFVRAGLGLAFIPQDALPTDGVCRIKLREELPGTVFGIVRSTIRPPTAAARALHDALVSSATLSSAPG